MKQFHMSLLIAAFILLFAVSCGDDDDDNDDQVTDDDDDAEDDDDGADDDDNDTADDDDDDDDDDSTPPDTVPPVFDGVTDALQGENSVCLTWAPASDDVDAPEDIVYNVYMAETSGAQDFSIPTQTTAGGAVEACVTGLYYAGNRFFVVRAQDTSGNEDANEVERFASPRPTRYVLEDGTGSGYEPTDPAGVIQAAMEDIGANKNGIVYVAAGTYEENLEMLPGIALKGGYKTDFTEENPELYPSLLPGTGAADTSIVKAANGTGIEGFTITGALGAGSGIDAENASPLISNNLITGNNRSGIYFGAVPERGGEKSASSPQIYENRIIGNGNLPCQYTEKYRNGIHYIRYYFEPCGGIYGYNLRGSTLAEIRDNIIEDNVGHGISVDIGYTGSTDIDVISNWIENNTGDGFEAELRGFYSYYGDDPGILKGTIQYNRIRNNRNGIFLTSDQRSIFEPVISNNIITANNERGIDGSVTGFIGWINIFGFWVFYDLPSELNLVINNNIISQNAAGGIRTAANGFDWYPYSTHPLAESGTIDTSIINNVISLNNGPGVEKDLDTGGSGTPEILNSAIVDNQDDLVSCSATYSNISDGDGGTGNLSVDSGFVHIYEFVDFTVGIGTTSTLVVNDSALYATGDYLVINADGQSREITDVPSGTEVEFSPALLDTTIPDMAVAYWGSETNGVPDFHLDAGSQLIDAGNPAAEFNDAQPPGQGTARNDIGAYGGPGAGEVGPEE